MMGCLIYICMFCQFNKSFYNFIMHTFYITDPFPQVVQPIVTKSEFFFINLYM